MHWGCTHRVDGLGEGLRDGAGGCAAALRHGLRQRLRQGGGGAVSLRLGQGLGHGLGGGVGRCVGHQGEGHVRGRRVYGHFGRWVAPWKGRGGKRGVGQGAKAKGVVYEAARKCVKVAHRRSTKHQAGAVLRCTTSKPVR